MLLDTTWGALLGRLKLHLQTAFRDSVGCGPAKGEIPVCILLYVVAQFKTKSASTTVNVTLPPFWTFLCLFEIRRYCRNPFDRAVETPLVLPW